jgi:hypothetical protein
VFEEDSGPFSIQRDALALEVTHGEHGHGVLMVLGGEFGVELSGLDIVFFKSVFTNKVIVGELMDGLNGFGVEELSIGDEIDVLVVFEEDFAFGIELFFEVLVVRVGGSEVVVVYVGVFDD